MIQANGEDEIDRKIAILAYNAAAKVVRDQDSNSMPFEGIAERHPSSRARPDSRYR